MDFQEAIRKIEERGDFNRSAEVKPIFTERLERLREGDHTERGLCYYYLLISYLKAHLVHETQEAIEFYEAMDDAFTKQEEVYRKDKKKFAWGEMRDYFRLMNRCYGSLEILYVKHDFRIRRLASHRRKMQFKKDSFFFNSEYWHWFEYKVLEITSDYGTSLTRWSITTIGFVVFMGVVYGVVDLFTDPAMRIVQDSNLFDYIYFSLITLTAVGFGDVFPLAIIAKMLVMLEAFLGLVMLGIFIGLINKKL